MDVSRSKDLKSYIDTYEVKGQRNHGLSRSKDLDFNSKLAEKRWVWAEVKIWNLMMLCLKRRRKIMGFGFAYVLQRLPEWGFRGRTESESG